MRSASRVANGKSSASAGEDYADHKDGLEASLTFTSTQIRSYVEVGMGTQGSFKCAIADGRSWVVGSPPCPLGRSKHLKAAGAAKPRWRNSQRPDGEYGAIGAAPDKAPRYPFMSSYYFTSEQPRSLGRGEIQGAKPNVGPQPVTLGKRTIRLPTVFLRWCHEFI